MNNYFKYFGIVIHAILRAFFEAFLVNLIVKYIMSYRIIETTIVARIILITHSIPARF